VEHLADRLAAIPGVVAVSLGGSRATGTAGPDSDWDFGLYYRGTIDPADVAALGWPGRVFAPGEWGRLVDGGAWLSVDGAQVDLCYRDLDVVLRWTAEAEAGRFEIQREVGYVAGIPTYVLAAELGLGRVLAGSLPRPAFPAALRASAPPLWSQLAAGALHHAEVFARRGDRVACVANAAQAVLACGWARLAAAGRWSVNEKRLVAAAGLDAAQAVLADDVDLVAMVDALAPVLDLPPWGA
jgi:Nucleotidyltransferase domain